MVEEEEDEEDEEDEEEGAELLIWRGVGMLLVFFLVLLMWLGLLDFVAVFVLNLFLKLLVGVGEVLLWAFTITREDSARARDDAVGAKSRLCTRFLAPDFLCGVVFGDAVPDERVREVRLADIVEPTLLMAKFLLFSLFCVILAPFFFDFGRSRCFVSRATMERNMIVFLLRNWR